MSIGIAAIFHEIPPLRLENEPRAIRMGSRPGTLERRVGVTHISRMTEGEDSSDMCVAAALKMFSSGIVTPEEIECAIVVTQNPDGCGLPHTSAIVHGKLGLPASVAAFDVGLGCSGFVYGLSIMKAFMEANGFRRGLLFTADPYSKIIDDDDKRTALLFGDAAAVTLMSDEPVWEIGKFDFGTIGKFGSSLEVRVKEDGKLHMDGKAVLNFSMDQVPDSIRRTMERNSVGIADVDRFMLHQGSRVVLENLRDNLDLGDRAAFLAGSYGNTVSSSIPIILADNAQEDDRVIVISGFGVGLSWASTVLFRAGAPAN